jgi:hypothetical protein
MLGSNQRPLPCEGGAIMPQLFVVVQKHLQNRTFASGSIHICSPLFVWVGVLLVYISLTATPRHAQLLYDLQFFRGAAEDTNLEIKSLAGAPCPSTRVTGRASLCGVCGPVVYSMAAILQR